MKMGLDSDIVKKVIHRLKLIQHSMRSTQTQSQMFEKKKILIRHYETSSTTWNTANSGYRMLIRQSSSTHGFIETYRVIRERGSCHSAQVRGVVLPLLPVYERQSFRPPSYNAVDLLTILSSDTPIGINHPNYDEIKLNFGFKKNVFAFQCVLSLQFRLLPSPSFLTEAISWQHLFGISGHFKCRNPRIVSGATVFCQGSSPKQNHPKSCEDRPDLLSPGVKFVDREGENFPGRVWKYSGLDLGVQR
jgi:hypothetical protein